jgi:hypothetical protein
MKYIEVDAAKQPKPLWGFAIRKGTKDLVITKDHKTENSAKTAGFKLYTQLTGRDSDILRRPKGGASIFKYEKNKGIPAQFTDVTDKLTKYFKPAKSKD